MSSISFFRRNIFVGTVEVLGRLPLIFTAGYIARTTGPELYGTWALVIVFQHVVVSLASMGTSSALSRMASVATEAKARSYLSFALRTTALAFTIVATATVLLRPFVASAFGIPRELDWLLLGGLLLAAAGIAEGALDGYFKARGFLGRQAALVLSRSFLEVAVIVTVFRVQVWDPGDTKDLLLVYAVGVVATKAVVYSSLIPRRGGQFESLTAVDRRQFLLYGLPMIPAALAIWLTVQGDSLVLGHLVSQAELGRYALGATLALYMSYIGLVVYPLLLPEASILYDGGRSEELDRLFRSSQRVFVALFTAAMAVIGLCGAEIIEITAGSAYFESRRVLVILSLAVGLEGLFGIYQWTFHLVKRTTFILWTNLAYLVLEVAAVIVAERLGGVAAVPWAVLGVVIVVNAVRYGLARRLLRLPVPGDVLVTAGVVSLVSLPSGIWSHGWPLIPRLIVVVLITVGATGSAIMRLSTREARPLPMAAPPGSRIQRNRP